MDKIIGPTSSLARAPRRAGAPCPLQTLVVEMASEANCERIQVSVDNGTVILGASTGIRTRILSIPVANAVDYTATFQGRLGLQIDFRPAADHLFDVALTLTFALDGRRHLVWSAVRSSELDPEIILIWAGQDF